MTDTADGSTGAGERRDVTAMLMPELRRVAVALGIKSAGMKKADLVGAVRSAQGGGGAPRPSTAGADAGTRAAGPVEKTAHPEEQPKQGRRQKQKPESASAQEPSEQRTDEPTGPPTEQQADQPRSRTTEQPSDAPRVQEDGAARQEPDVARQKDQQKDRQKDQGAKSTPKSKAGGQGGSDGSPGQSNQNNQESGKKQDDAQQQNKQGNQNGSENQRQKNAGQSGQSGQSGQGTQGSQGGQGGADLDDDLGSRRNRRRRGRDRQPVTGSRGGGNGGGSGSGSGSANNRNEPDTTILDDDVLLPCAGILDVLDNYAFVRTTGYLPGPDDVYVSLSMVRKLGLRPGDAVGGQVRLPREGERKEKFNPLVKIDSVNGADPELARSRKEFGSLTPVFPTERLRLETRPEELIGRVVDVAAPIGKGQRGLIVSPARAGRTTVLRAIADAVSVNNPECHLMVVLIDERPEEVTEFERSVKGEVIASTFDRPPSDHTAIAELAIERAKRLVELEHDVVLLLDGITTLGRAYNLAAAPSGRTLDGGVDASALYPPKKFFGAARNVENGGSLTIVATAAIESGSAMDEVILEEFEGTATMELRLRRDLADRWIFPAVDAVRSGTRREDLLMGEEEAQIVRKLRRAVSELAPQRGLEMLLARISHTRTNYEFLASVQRASEAELTTVD